MKLEFKKKEDTIIKYNGQKISVKPYLTSEDMIIATEIALRSCSDSIKEINEFATLPNAKVAYDFCVLKKCTNIEIEDTDIDDIILSGIIDVISPYIYNYKSTLEMIYLAISNQTLYKGLNLMATSIPTEEKMKSTITDMSAFVQELNKNPDILRKVAEFVAVTQVKEEAKKEIKSKKKE